MKIKKFLSILFVPLLLVVMILSISSCNSNKEIVFVEDDSQTNYTNANNVSPGGESKSSSDEVEQGSYTSVVANITDDSTASPKTDVEETVEKVYDSVVSISVTATEFTASGSGVLFQEDLTYGLSYIITCFHVIDGAYKYDITLADGTTYNASLVGGYEKEDLAILSIEATGLTYASIFTDSDTLKLGSTVVCIGNPLGTLPGSVSQGVLSYVNRTIKTDSYTYQQLLQTDVAINSGNSGGGLFNASGVLIGIVNAKYSDESIEGLGFAIPSNTVKRVINAILSTAQYNATSKNWHEGYYEGDWTLGVSISDGYYTSGSGWSARSYTCVYISEISGETTASKGDLAVNNIITGVKITYSDSAKESVSLTSISQASDVLSFIYQASLTVGDTITFTITTRSNSSTKTNVDVALIQYIYQD